MDYSKTADVTTEEVDGIKVYSITRKRFDPNTGEELEPAQESYTVDQLQEYVNKTASEAGYWKWVAEHK